MQPKPTDWRVAVERERRRRQAQRTARLAATRFAPEVYLREVLGWQPWSGTDELPGQAQVIEAYRLALLQQHEKRDYEAGVKAEADLQYWTPGQTIKNIIRVEAGHTTGKTHLAAGLVNHFFDHFEPSVTYTYAPSWEQIKDLLWKGIASQRAGRGLPGRLLETCEIKDKPNHFAKGRATNNAGGKGTERVQGQHEEYLLFVLDEAEGVDEFVFNAINSMTSGGISIVLMLANPRTRSSRFYKIQSRSNVANFRISCLHHPNVVAGREIIPGAVKRDYVTGMIEENCEVVAAHDADNFTFEVDWMPGTILQPSAEFMFRVLGVAPANISDKTLVPVGRFEAACKRKPVSSNPHIAYFGVDVARFGADFGTLYIRHDGAIWRARKFSKLDSLAYRGAIKEEAKRLRARGVTHLHLRVDGGGGFGSGIIDNVKGDLAGEGFTEIKVFEIHFGGEVKDEKAYQHWITEATADVAESLKGLSVLNAPNELQGDLCEREYKWVNQKGVAVKRLEPKEDFRKRQDPPRSPDDGDGFVLAAVSEFLLTYRRWQVA